MISCVFPGDAGECDATYGAGTLMTVLTIVTDAPSDSTLPFRVARLTLPTVENDAPACEMMVPTIVPPPAALMVAELPTCQNTFLACAPPARMMLCGAATPGPPTVSACAIWNTNTALASP